MAIFQFWVMPMATYISSFIYGATIGHPWLGMLIGFGMALVWMFISWVLMWRIEFGEWTFWK